MKIGILTSGGDCPGLNSVIRGAVLNGVISHDAEFVGFRWGWKGVVEADIMPITRHDVRGLSKQGGTILGSSRTNPYEGEGGGPENIQRMLDEHSIDAIIAIAGPGTKVVCLGNIAQIDTPYLTEGSSGLTYVVDRMKGWPHAGHVTLARGERSRLADHAATAL